MASSDRRYWGFAVASSATGWVHYRCADQIKDIADSIRNARVIHLTNGQKLEHP